MKKFIYKNFKKRTDKLRFEKKCEDPYWERNLVRDIDSAILRAGLPLKYTSLGTRNPENDFTKSTLMVENQDGFSYESLPNEFKIPEKRTELTEEQKQSIMDFEKQFGKYQSDQSKKYWEEIKGLFGLTKKGE